jgi:hypothetical protein
METRRGEELMERLIAAVEKLSEPQDPSLSFNPPVCPHCDVFDPVVEIPYQEGGTGKLSEIITVVTCLACRNRFYIVTESYSPHKEVQSAALEISERAKAGAV